MYNKKFFEKVVNVDCSFKELKSFCANIDKENTIRITLLKNIITLRVFFKR